MNEVVSIDADVIVQNSSSRRKRETMSGIERYVLTKRSSARVIRDAARRMARPHVAQ